MNKKNIGFLRWLIHNYDIEIIFYSYLILIFTVFLGSMILTISLHNPLFLFIGGVSTIILIFIPSFINLYQEYLRDKEEE